MLSSSYMGRTPRFGRSGYDPYPASSVPESLCGQKRRGDENRLGLETETAGPTRSRRGFRRAVSGNPAPILRSIRVDRPCLSLLSSFAIHLPAERRSPLSGRLFPPRVRTAGRKPLSAISSFCASSFRASSSFFSSMTQNRIAYKWRGNELRLQLESELSAGPEEDPARSWGGGARSDAAGNGS